MPENFELEILMQEKMAEFRVEPVPGDWQAIYEVLHPKKRRRILWWLLPLVAGMAVGIYWINDKKAGIPSSIPEIKTTINNEKQVSPVVNNETGSGTPTTAKINTEPKTENTTTKISVDNTTKQQRIKPYTAQSPSHEKYSQYTINENPGASVEPPDLRSKNVTNHSNNTISSTETGSTSTQTNGDKIGSEGTDSTSTATTPEATSSDSARKNVPVVQKEADRKTIPNLSNHNAKGWYLGGYAGIGSNVPTASFSMTKSADLNSAPSTGSSSLTTYENSMQSGLHYALGISLERKMKSNSFSIGLGIQHNSWTATSTTYKDSIVSGSMYSRTPYSNNISKYSHFALELPVMVNFKIAGKSRSTYWISTGLNNAITLNLSQKTEFNQNNAGNRFDHSVLTNASTYQPQFRVGLTYQHTQSRYHWQLNPFLQYGLTEVVKSGSPDIHMLHWGVQARYYFSKFRN